jgi:hypothetical protein
MDKEHIFSTFRPYCAALASKPSKEILDKLSNLVAESNPQHLEMLQEYILFPCQLYLRTPVMPENYTIKVLNFVEHFFSQNSTDRVKLNSNFLMADLLQSILQLMSGSKNISERPTIDLSEDLRVSICDCVCALIKSSTTEVKTALYSEEQKLALSHLVFQVLEWSQCEVRQVAIASLRLIDSLCFRNEEIEHVHQLFVGQFCQMLPGITTKLVKTLQQENKNSDKIKPILSNKIIVKCLAVWRHYVVNIFNDHNVSDPQMIENDLHECSNKAPLLSDTTWIGKAQDHLLSHLQIFGRSFSTHSKLSVREEMLQVCVDLVEFCSKNSLSNLNSILVEILASLTVDDESAEIRQKSRKCLQKLLENFVEKCKIRDLNLGK